MTIRYLVWQTLDGSLVFPAVNDEQVEEASLAVLAHMNNRELLGLLDDGGRSTALYLLGIVPNDPDQAQVQQETADTSATATALLNQIILTPGMGKVEFDDL